MAGTGTAVTWPESSGLVVVALGGPSGGADMTDRQRFYAIRRRWMRAKQAEETYRTRRFWPRYRTLRPERSWMTSGEIRQLERFAERLDAVSDEMFALLDRIGGRSWRHYVPHWWVMENLTYEQATTTGELVGDIPAAYGTSLPALREFMQPVQGEMA